MMLGEDVHFSDAEGSAASFVNDGHFDFTSFEQNWHDQQLFNTLAPMIKQQLDIDNIDQHPKFKSIIMAAYKAGKDK